MLARVVGGTRVVGGARVVSGTEKKILIEVALFGRLDQMLRTTVQGGVLSGLCPPSPKLGNLEVNAPPAKFFKNFLKFFFDGTLF